MLRHFFISIVMMSLCANAQGTDYLDSLANAYAEKDDTTKIKAYQEYARPFRQADPTRYHAVHSEVLALATPHVLSSDTAGDYFYFLTAIRSFHQMAIIDAFQGGYAQALEMIDKASRISLAINDSSGLCNSYNLLGYVYANINDNAAALDNFNAGLEIARQMENLSKQVQISTNIGAIYKNKADSAISAGNHQLAEDFVDEAIAQFEYSAEYGQLIGRTSSVAVAYANIGGAMLAIDSVQAALEYNLMALDLAKESDEPYRICEAEIGLAKVYRADENLDLAIAHGRTALESAQRLKLLSYEEMAARHLYECHLDVGNNRAALHFLKLHEVINDSLNREENLHAGIKLKYDRQYAVQKASEKISFEMRKQIKDAEIAQQDAELASKRTRLFTLYGLSVILLLLLFGTLRGYRRKKRDNLIIQQQKRQVVQQQRMMVDSISYAEKIQQSILPDKEIIRQHLPGFKALYRPRDIVSGDFYWFAEREQILYLALADCTGHGVPGAFMSMIGSTLLKEIIVGEKLEDPANILTALDKKVKEMLKQRDASDSDDGMEITLVKINPIDKEMTFAGANQHVYVVRDEVEIVKGDLRGIGGWVRNPARLPKFSNKIISLKGVKAIYLASDGLEDQFKEITNEKFGRNRFVEKIAGGQPSVELLEIEQSFDEWRGSFSQIDDVCVLGVKLS